MRVVLSRSASVRLSAARQLVLEFPPHSEWLIVAASRAAADDFARSIAAERGATFGLHRFSLTQLAARLAAPLLARERLTATTGLGVQAVAARALFDAHQDHALPYFGAVAETPGFPRALARTLEELSLAIVSPASVRRSGRAGADLGELLERFDAQFDAASAVERARFLERAASAVAHRSNPYAACRLLLLDVPVGSAVERSFVEALVSQASIGAATTPVGDDRSFAVYQQLGVVEQRDPPVGAGLDRIRQHLFSSAAPPSGDPLDEVELFSAPGEGREAVEIARRVLREAHQGLRFDEMAIALRAPQQYAGLLEHALERAGVPACFERGTRRPHPAGRAFLALLRCAADHLSARRFAEYLSLGQVPEEGSDEQVTAFPLSDDEVFGALAERSVDDGPVKDDEEAERPPRFRSPWKWERLLAESRVVASAARWERRLAGLMHECALQRAALERSEPDSPRIDYLRQKAEDIHQLQSFALPIMRTLAGWPQRALWKDWLDAFEALAPRVLRRPDRVLRVLADLRPMGAIGPVGLDEAAAVLADRLGSIEADPPSRRYGRVLVTTPAQLRGRSFSVVFVPALAERLFPQRPREDPLLLDDARRELEGLVTQTERAELEKLNLTLAAGAAESKLYVSFPTVEVGDGRPRVPSLYALEVWRAMTGRVPSADELQRIAAHASRATLAWPAPPDRDEAIDPLEHDLSTLRSLIAEPDHRARGRAQYLLQLNECLQRSVRERYMRGKPAWSRWDGIAGATERLRPVLDAYRLGVRAYSLSALQRYAACPYQFFLGAIWRMRPPDELGAIERMDPLTRGSLFHAVQASFYRRMKAEGRLPMTERGRGEALNVLDEAIAEVTTREHEELAPAIDRIWHDEIAAIRRDLRLWVDAISHDSEWVPKWFEWSFGLRDSGRDEESRPEPVSLDGRFTLHGSVDLVEQRADGALRVTDHKTGKFRGKDRMVVDGGAALQPVLYSMALETATGHPVVEGRLYYVTVDGGFREASIPLTDDARRAGIEVLEIIDRAVETGFLAPAPREHACTWCDFRLICGPLAEQRADRKAREPLADLLALRGKP